MRASRFSDEEIEKIVITANILGDGPAARRFEIGMSTLWSYRRRVEDVVGKRMRMSAAWKMLRDEHDFFSQQLGLQPTYHDDILELESHNNELAKQWKEKQACQPTASFSNVLPS